MSTRLIWFLLSLGNALIWSGIIWFIFNSVIITVVIAIIAFMVTMMVGAICVAAGSSDENGEER